MLSIATAAVAVAAVPAEAATVLNSTCSGNCFTSPLVNIVNLTSATNTSLGVGTIAGNTVNFTSSTDSLNLANGAATISATDGSGFGQLTFELLGGVGFTYADFSLDQATKALDLFFTLSDGTTQTVSIGKATGSEPFGIQADVGTYITKVAFNTTDGSFTTFKQLKLGGFSNVPAVPEPATWAMMLLGFGAMGASLRRNRRRSGKILQIA